MANANEGIRLLAKSKQVKLWQIADQMGVSSAWFSVRLRKELPECDKQKVLEIIERLSEGADK